MGSLALTPAFDGAVTEYTAITANATNVLTATASGANAVISITVNGSPVSNGSAATWDAGANVVSVAVTNGEASKVYNVTVTKS